jgi:hypothetical protein
MADAANEIANAILFQVLGHHGTQLPKLEKLFPFFLIHHILLISLQLVLINMLSYAPAKKKGTHP